VTLSAPTLLSWLGSLGIDPDVTLMRGPRVTGDDDMDDRRILATITGGPGMANDGASEQATFQLRTRGGQNNYDDAETIALDVDDRIKFAPFPMKIDGCTFQNVRRLGSQPTPLGGTPDDGDRYELVANYIATVGMPI
jgi:hypothetical protein